MWGGVYGKDRALGKVLGRSSQERALVPMGVEEIFPQAGAAVAFVILGNKEENVGCCSKKFWS